MAGGTIQLPKVEQRWATVVGAAVATGGCMFAIDGTAQNFDVTLLWAPNRVYRFRDNFDTWVLANNINLISPDTVINGADNWLGLDVPGAVITLGTGNTLVEGYRVFESSHGLNGTDGISPPAPPPVTVDPFTLWAAVLL